MAKSGFVYSQYSFGILIEVKQGNKIKLIDERTDNPDRMIWRILLIVFFPLVVLIIRQAKKARILIEGSCGATKLGVT